MVKATNAPSQIQTSIATKEEQQVLSPLDVKRNATRFRRQKPTKELDEYFIGPRDINRHSRWPFFMRMQGSILPEMILPITFVTLWATIITCLSKFIYPLAVSNVLLTIMGFVVGLSLSFRSSTAYERYADGRKYWSQLIHNSNILARIIWLHAETREGENGKTDLLAKMSGLNLILAFAVSLKHKLRFEPYTYYDDLRGLVDHLDTFAKEAEEPSVSNVQRCSKWKSTGLYLGVSFAVSNPRKTIKQAKKPLGNLPLEVHMYLSAYLDKLMLDEQIQTRYQSTTLNSLNALNEVLSGTDRILSTPLPIAYQIAISQITWVYVLLLPFQLFESLGWVTIPGTTFAAYIILGIALIGSEIENPFGNDVNDLPLENYCAQIADELDIISASPPPKATDFITRANNLVLFPLSRSGYQAWATRSEDRIRDALRTKARVASRKNSECSEADGNSSRGSETTLAGNGHVHGNIEV